MKFDFQIDNNEDLEHFKVLFFRNVGCEQIMYNFYMGDVMVRAQVSGMNGAQLIGLGFFHFTQEGKSTTLQQFHPLTDSRFWHYETIMRLWGSEHTSLWAHFDHWPQDTESAFDTVRDLLRVVYKTNKLKAFL